MKGDRLALRAFRRLRGDLKARGVPDAAAEASARHAVERARGYLLLEWDRRSRAAGPLEARRAPRAVMWSAYRTAYRALRVGEVLQRREGA